MTTTRKANGKRHPAATADAGYLFRVPADKKGRRFIRELRQHINRHDIDRVRILCNGPRKETALADGLYARGYQSYLPQRHATEFRVYVDRTSDSARWRERYDAQQRIERLNADLERALRLGDKHAERLMTLSESAKRLVDENVRLRAKFRNVPDWMVRLCDWATRKVR